MKTKITFIALLLTSIVIGQNQKEGEIVISKTHLISLLQKFKQQDSIKLDKTEVTKELLLADNKIGNDSVAKRVKDLESQVALLNAKIDAAVQHASIKDTVVVSSSNTFVVRDTLYRSVVDANKYQKTNLVKEDDNYEQQLNTLNRKYEALLRNQESLLALQKQNSTVIVPLVSPKEPKPVQELTNVKSYDPVSSLVVVKDSIAINSSELNMNPVVSSAVVPEIMKEKHGAIRAQVFFENNSAQINSNDALRLQQLIKILNQDKNLYVFLEGYTSKTGNFDYNNKLSLLRNDAVKQFLISKGISVKRILSEHHGVDANSLNDAAARRVDVSFDVVK